MPSPQPSVRDQLPRTLRANARWERIGEIPVMLVTAAGEAPGPAPLVIWLHGRTAHKELDPGRYLRLMRAGIGVCAVDLPGHGERREARLQEPEHSLEVVSRTVEEIDLLVEALGSRPEVEGSRLGVGGMSAGGMAVLARLCRPHGFRGASVEATSGSWRRQGHRAMFAGAAGPDPAAGLDPIRHLDGWREIPLQAFHARGDEWMSFEGQREFIDALRRRYRRPELVDFVVFDATGAPYEHVGFGRMAAEVKNRQAEFFGRVLSLGES